MTLPKEFPALVITQSDDNAAPNLPATRVSKIGFEDVGDIVVRIRYSSLNYKDALAAAGNRAVARKFPLVPGIDAVGTVVEPANSPFSVGDEIFISHAKFGTAHHGGLAHYARVPADWVYPVPDGLSMLDTVTWGTAGFTAAQSVEQIIAANIGPDSGPVVVTGATGGVGILAVKLLNRLGYTVVASTGKPDKSSWLIEQGATEVIDRRQLNDETPAPLLKSRWAAAIDTVGGNTLTTLVRSTRQNACVTACGLVGGNELPLTVFPFILRGVKLCGIDSANVSRETRLALWKKIGSVWALNNLKSITETISLDELPGRISRMLDGQNFGRTIIEMPDR